MLPLNNVKKTNHPVYQILFRCFYVLTPHEKKRANTKNLLAFRVFSKKNSTHKLFVAFMFKLQTKKTVVICNHDYGDVTVLICKVRNGSLFLLNLWFDVNN